MFRWSHPWTLAAVGLLSIGFAGCTNAPPDFQPTPVSGKVLHKGQPLAEATVTFHPMGGLPPSNPLNAITDEDGRFRMTFRQENDGVPPGEYAVTIVLRARRQDGDDQVRNGKNLLPPRYADPDTSGLLVTVRPGENNLPPFQLAD
jgi:hypothetical protein